MRNAGGVTQYWANGRAIGRVRQVALPPMRIMRISSFNKGLVGCQMFTRQPQED